MKFGQTLRDRSVPQWKTYNIDYSTIKNYIKDHTTPGKGKAVAIPGNDDSVVDEVEDQLFAIFSQEHKRISLFAKSKSYEINSRLDSIARQLTELRSVKSQTALQRNSVAIRRKYSRVESEILKVGEEIQNISRFTSINKLAVRKLLKKYQKWSRSKTLTARVEDKILKDPDGFFKAELTPALNRYTSYLDSVRSAFGVRRTHGDGIDTPRSAGSDGPVTATELSMFQGSSVEFDMALALRTERSHSGTRATYWVHPDNVLELRVLLLQHMRHAKHIKAVTRSASARRKGSDASFVEKEAEFNTLVVGRLDSFDNDTLEVKDSDAVRKALCPVIIRWSVDGDAAVFVSPHQSESPKAHVETKVAKLRKAQLWSFMNLESEFPPKSVDSSDDEAGYAAITEATLEQKRVRQLLSVLDEIEPLAHIRGRRSRFVGLENSQDTGNWAALDCDVQMQATSQEALKNFETLNSGVFDAYEFPHAVLTVRSVGDDRNLQDILDRSHLTERVKDFSESIHAISVCCKNTKISEPHWFSLLHKDIRHVPANIPAHSRTPSNLSLSIRDAAARRTSKSTTDNSAEGPATPQDGQPIVGRPLRQARYLPPLETIPDPSKQVKYWNEYDNPQSDDGNDDAFMIYVDPNAPVFPGQEMFQRWGQKVTSLFRSKKNNDPDSEQKAFGDEHSPLLSTMASTDSSAEGYSPSSDTSSSEDEGPADKSLTRAAHQKRIFFESRRKRSLQYGTLPVSRYDTHAQADLVHIYHDHFRTAMLSLTISLTILAVSALIFATGRRKFQAQIHLLVCVGIAASIALAILAAIHLIRGYHGPRKQLAALLVPDLRTATFCLLFVLVCMGDTWLLANVLQ